MLDPYDGQIFCKSTYIIKITNCLKYAEST